ncbi:glycoside hydrolase family 16 protein [Gordonia soli]|uniref:GH16 domain-containing protein n=1 Tax=Gordonia soli NBRC 108243 TaxID=1223545 RepID=M0QMT4_9ACTN|nr:glycoside hydrolase family 16 protein [Gordonia soli]GAC69858.1 hypothetical protein GS4_28_01060 [Gordonia soli NBRC 108243]
MYGRDTLDEDFTGGLDESVWTPAYLPGWSSRVDARADLTTGPDGLTLRIPPEHPIWCADQHDPPLRVSAVQSGNWSGPLGSTAGQQPFRPGLRVREEQSAQWGVTPFRGRVEVTCRAELTPESMFSAWLIGLEDSPARCGEICVVEVFGSTMRTGSTGEPLAAVGRGVHAFRDPALQEEFAAPEIAIDVSEVHTYSIDWSADGVVFEIDGRLVHTTAQSPEYPMQLIIAVFDFPPDGALRGPDDPVPAVHVSRVVVRPDVLASVAD